MRLRYLAVTILAIAAGHNAPASITRSVNEHSRVWSEKIRLPRASDLQYPKGIAHFTVEDSRSEPYKFLHDSAIVSHNGVLYAGWFNSPETEIADEALIRYRTSTDGGKTWSAVKVLAADHEKRGYFYVPIQFLSHGGRLLAYVGRMVGHDAITDCLVYLFNEQTEQWNMVGKAADRFLPNCPPVRMANGNWVMAGRVAAQPAAQPLMPALLISHGDRLTEEWRVQPLQKTPFPEKQHPETTVILEGTEITAFVRNSFEAIPCIYTSTDFGETWTEVYPHDFQAIPSKMFGGVLSNGQKYLIYNYPDFSGKIRNIGLSARGKLAIAVTAPGGARFEKVWMVQGNGPGKPFSSHYPSAIETEGNLHIVYTTGSGGGVGYAKGLRGCELAVIPVESLHVGLSER